MSVIICDLSLHGISLLWSYIWTFHGMLEPLLYLRKQLSAVTA